MRSFVWRVIINALALLALPTLMKGVLVDNIFAAFIAALVLGVLNAVIRPLLLLFTLPFNIMTLGLFTFVVNGLVLGMVSALVAGFSSGGFFYTIAAAFVLSIISALLSWLLGGPDKHK